MNESHSAILRRDVIKLDLGLPRDLPDAIGFGAYLKNTVCVVTADRAYLSDDVGDLDNPVNLRGFEDTVDRMLDETGATPAAAGHDLHPDFFSTRFAHDFGAPTVAVQHHHAHIAAVAAENGVDGPVVGLALDGFGLGPNYQSWGGELLYVDGPSWRRLGHLRTLPQPGGDAASRAPWRMAAGLLHRLGRGDEIAKRFSDLPLAGAMAQVLDAGVNCPETSSAGRLFDAAAALVGLHPVADFEGQAPMALEALVETPRVLEGGWRLAEDGVLDFLATLEIMLDLPPQQAAELFHGTLIDGLAHWAAQACASTGSDAVAMGGGCFFNHVLRDNLCARLRAANLRPLVSGSAGPGDSAVSLGQAVIAALTVERGDVSCVPRDPR